MESKMKKVEFVTDIMDDEFGEPSKYKVYLEKDSSLYHGWYYNDLFVKRGDVIIFRIFDGSHNSLAYVCKEFSDFADEFVRKHDFAIFDEFEIKEEIKLRDNQTF